MRRSFLVFFLLLMLLTACDESAPSSSNNEGLEPAEPGIALVDMVYEGLDQRALSQYQAEFLIQFEGDFNWVYKLTTRYDGVLLEYYLHLEGVDESQNLGDIRLVTDGEHSWMTGPGADHECFMYPSNMDIGLVFLTPDDFLNPESLAQNLVEEGSETIAGMDTVFFSSNAAALNGWEITALNLFLKDPTTVLRYAFLGYGVDPLFGAGEGAISAEYLVLETQTQDIQAVTGCEIEIPIPDFAENLTRFPDLIYFDSPESVEDTADFFLTALYEARWVMEDEPVIYEDGAIEITYNRLGNSVIIRIKPGAEGSQVQILGH